MAPQDFLCFGHGSTFHPDRVGTCDEVWVWFERPLTMAERRHVVSSCPEPLRSFQWSDQFAYFGSPGDVFDTLLVDTYGSSEVREAIAAAAVLVDAGKAREVDFDALALAANPDVLPRFAEAVTTWLRRVHARVPILFARFPHGAVEDDWAAWSAENVGAALQAMERWEAANRWVREGGRALVKPADGPTNGPRVAKRQIAVLDRNQVAECYDWIRAEVEMSGAVSTGSKRSVPATEVGVLELSVQLREGSMKEPNRSQALDRLESILHQNPGLIAGTLLENTLAAFLGNGRADDGLELLSIGLEQSTPWTSGILAEAMGCAMRCEEEHWKLIAIGWYREKQSALGPGDPRIHEGAACVMAEQGDFDEATEAFARFKGDRSLVLSDYDQADYAGLRDHAAFVALF